MPFTLPSTDQSNSMMSMEQVTKQTLLHSFRSLIKEFAHGLLFGVCLSLVLTVTSHFNMIILALPSFLFIYSLTMTTIYMYLINIKSSLLKDSQSSDQSGNNLIVPLTLSLISRYEKWFGSLLGGTQWLIIVLRRFGAQIEDDVIIEDMSCVEDVHLITIDSHARLSSTSRIQVGSLYFFSRILIVII